MSDRKEITPYAQNDEAMEKIQRACNDLRKLAIRYSLPMYATFAVSNQDGHTEYCTLVYSAGAHNIRLAEDRISRHMLVDNGFVPVSARDKDLLDRAMDSGLLAQLPPKKNGRPQKEKSAEAPEENPEDEADSAPDVHE